jgi:hypothetical protein
MAMIIMVAGAIAASASVPSFDTMITSIKPISMRDEVIAMIGAARISSSATGPRPSRRIS